MTWIRVQEQSPNIDQIVVAWMLKRKEPCCVRYTKDTHGPLWVELVECDIWEDREDIITHWMPLPESPNE